MSRMGMRPITQLPYPFAIHEFTPTLVNRYLNGVWLAKRAIGGVRGVAPRGSTSEVVAPDPQAVSRFRSRSDKRAPGVRMDTPWGRPRGSTSVVVALCAGVGCPRTIARDRDLRALDRSFTQSIATALAGATDGPYDGSP